MRVFLEIAEGLLPGEDWEPDLLCWILSQSLVLQIVTGIYAQCHVFFVFDILSHDFPCLKPSLIYIQLMEVNLQGRQCRRKGGSCFHPQSGSAKDCFI